MDAAEVTGWLAYFTVRADEGDGKDQGKPKDTQAKLRERDAERRQMIREQE